MVGDMDNPTKIVGIVCKAKASCNDCLSVIIYGSKYYTYGKKEGKK